MKFLKNVIFLILLVVVPPSFACGCGDRGSSWSSQEIILAIALVLVYFLPTIYYLFCLGKNKLSLWVLFISHAVVLLPLLLGDLGLHYIYRSLMAYIPDLVVYVGYSLFLLLVWIFPACYAFYKVKLKSNQ